MSVASTQSFGGPPSVRWPARSWAWWAAALALAVAAYGPLLWMFFRQQWQKPHYQYFPFVIGAFVSLLAFRYAYGTPREAPSTGGRWIDGGILAAAIILLSASIYPLHSPWGAAASLILLMAYLCRVISRNREVVYLWGIWALLWLLVPLPFSLDKNLIDYLQHKSSQLSSYVLDLIGVNHVMEGNTLSLPARQLFVDEACSGIVSILSVVACALIYGVYKNRAPAHLAALAAAGIGWATVINVVRISTIAYALERWGVDWSAGASHEILSLALFMVTFLALLSTDQLLAAGLAPIQSVWHEVHSQDLRFGRWLATAWDFVLGWGRPVLAVAEVADGAAPAGSPPAPGPLGHGRRFVPALLVVGLAGPAVAQAALLGYAMRIAPENLEILPHALAFREDVLPASIDELKQVDFKPHERTADDLFGRYSKTFLYRDEATDAPYLVSLDFPFAGGWHELTVCYIANGWNGVERYIRRPPKGAPGEDGAQPWEYVEADFEKPGGEHSAVFFAEFDQFGAPIRPQPGWLDTGYSFIDVRNIHLSERHAFQVQVWVTRNGVVSAEDRETARNLLLDVRTRFRDRMVQAARAHASGAEVRAVDD
jgi:exosortase